MLLLCLTLLAAQSPEMQKNDLVSAASKPTLSQTSAATAEKKPAIVNESLNNGQFIRLSDGTLWEIHPGDRSITQSWISAVAINVVPSNDPNYPFRLTNSLTGSSVLARHATSLPKTEPKVKPPIKK